MANLLYKPEKNRQDIEELLAQHKNMVYYMLGRMSKLGNQDCESAAWEALWDAICTFDIYAETAFSTYAYKLMSNAINNELRKQALIGRHEATMFDIPDSNDLYMEVNTQDKTRYIEHAFKAYVANKQGICKSVLLVWHAAGFETAGNSIATVCQCSASYVSRVQRDFRAYLQCRLKKL